MEPLVRDSTLLRMRGARPSGELYSTPNMGTLGQGSLIWTVQSAGVIRLWTVPLAVRLFRHKRKNHGPTVHQVPRMLIS
jgi:hypothetical protein